MNYIEDDNDIIDFITQDRLRIFELNLDDTLNYLKYCDEDELYSFLTITEPFSHYFSPSRIVKGMRDNLVRFDNIDIQNDLNQEIDNILGGLKYDDTYLIHEDVLSLKTKRLNITELEALLIERKTLDDCNNDNIKNNIDSRIKLLKINYFDTLDYFKNIDENYLFLSIETLDELFDYFNPWPLIKILRKRIESIKNLNLKEILESLIDKNIHEIGIIVNSIAKVE